MKGDIEKELNGHEGRIMYLIKGNCWNIAYK